MDVTLFELVAAASSKNEGGHLDAAVWVAAGSLVVSVVSVGVAALGTWLAHRRATEAMEESKKAAASALWSDLQAVVQRFLGFDPSMEPHADRFLHFRTTAVALVDELEWDGFDKWLAQEHALGSALCRQALEQADPSDTLDERMEKLDPLFAWGMALSGNLRRLRKTGPDGDSMSKLRQHVEEQVEGLYEQNDWGQPPSGQSPRIKPLET